MTIRPCDELGLNLFEAGRKWGCELSVSVKVAICLVEDMKSFRGIRDFETRLEFALDLEEVWDENERHAYKMALGIFYNNRARDKREQLNIPFAPR